MRRILCAALSLAVFSCSLPSAEGAFSFEEVKEAAKDLAAKPYAAPAQQAPAAMLNLNYDQYQSIQFRRDKELWNGQGLPFQLEFFLPGHFHKQIVPIYEVDDQKAHVIPFDPAMFDPATNQISVASAGGYAGFRVEAERDNFGEAAVFLDASYYRMIGKGENYGLSSRGILMDMFAHNGEEFPAFRKFWVQRPGKTDSEILIYALLDGPSLAGAYRFSVRPGATTLVGVKLALFVRHEITKFGIAPLNSMFLFGKNGRPPYSDFRPEVHDSDGLLLHTGHGEWAWHPLENGKATRFNSFLDNNPGGFGLMQRERSFAAYEDPQAHYETRPGVWIQPRGKWGRGAVDLTQLLTANEYADNVVASWHPAEPLKPGTALELEYEMYWTSSDPVPPSLGHVLATRIGHVPEDTSKLRFVVDFAPPTAGAAPPVEELQADVSVGQGTQLLGTNLFKVENTGVWRLAMEVREPRQTAELRAVVQHAGRPVTETWTYTWLP